MIERLPWARRFQESDDMGDVFFPSRGTPRSYGQADGNKNTARRPNSAASPGHLSM